VSYLILLLNVICCIRLRQVDGSDRISPRIVCHL
jgi:hypothetical protein